MNRQTIAVLAMLNVVLLAALAFVNTPTQQAEATADDDGYAMVIGQTRGFTTDVIWILDSDNQRLVATAFDSRKKEFALIGRADMKEDLAPLDEKDD